MAQALTVVDSFRHGASMEPNVRVAFNSTGTYCAVGVLNNQTDAAYGVSPAEVWIYKLSAGHWSRVARLVTSTAWDNYEAWRIALADNLTVLSVGNNGQDVHRWKSTGTDTWATDSFFHADYPGGAETGYSGVAISSDGNVCVAWGDYNGDQDVKILTAVSTTQVLRQTLLASSNIHMGAALSSDGKFLAIGSVDHNRLEIWTSTTLGTSSWSMASSIGFTHTPIGDIHCVRLLADKSFIVVGYAAAFGGGNFVEVFQNTSGTTYASLGVWVGGSGDYGPVVSFGLTSGKKLIAASDGDEAWSVDDVSLTATGDHTMDSVAKPTGVTSTDPWAGSIDVDPTGTWACVVGNAWGETVGDDMIRFCTIATFIPAFAFWTEFVKSRETF